MGEAQAMNINTISMECDYGMCSHCMWDDCACDCHFLALCHEDYSDEGCPICEEGEEDARLS